MKCWLAWLMALCLLLGVQAACAAEFAFQQDMIVKISGQDIRITFDRVNRNAPGGTLLLIGEDGQVLAETKVNNSQKQCSFLIPAGVVLPAMQQVVLARLNDDGTIKPLSSATLFVDTPRHSCIARVDCEEKLIAITFDSANGVGKLYRLLDLLDRYDAKCTFFLQGQYVRLFPDDVVEIDRRGHELANHSTNHPDMREIKENRIYSEIKTTNDLMEELIGKPIRLYRPPAGYHTERDRAISRGLGDEPIFWTFDSKDGFKESSFETVRRRMYNETVNGSIILMHIYGQHTLGVLDEYIPAMQAQGYRFVTVSELLASGTLIDQLGNRYDPIPMEQ